MECIEERKVTGLFFDDNDDDGDDSNIEDENNDPTLSPSPNQQNPASTPSTSRRSGSSNSGGEIIGVESHYVPNNPNSNPLIISHYLIFLQLVIDNQIYFLHLLFKQMSSLFGSPSGFLCNCLVLHPSSFVISR